VFDGSISSQWLFEPAVHAFHLVIGPGMVGFGEAVPDVKLLVDTVEHVVEGILIACTVGELATVIGEHRFASVFGFKSSPLASCARLA
jgi:hypothetical protein